MLEGAESTSGIPEGRARERGKKGDSQVRIPDHKTPGFQPWVSWPFSHKRHIRLCSIILLVPVNTIPTTNDSLMQTHEATDF